MRMTTTMTQAAETSNAAQRSLSPHVTQDDTSSRERFPSFDFSATPNPTLPTLGDTSESFNLRSPVSVEYKWPSRKGSQRLREGRSAFTRGHNKRRSLSDAFTNIRKRQGSVTENAQELAAALKAPVSYQLIGLCIVWYMTSALTNTSSKSILNAFNKPVTLTVIQFASVSLWCFLLTTLAAIFPPLKTSIPALKNGLRRPSWDVLATALPLSIFQLLGHLLSSYATSKIPVSLVHTIKGLSPLFTVLAYRVLDRIKYARATYLSLIPLTAGVMLACSADFSTNFWGISAALAAAIVFVTQNIFSKKLFNESARAEADVRTKQSRKLDKLNLLCYCSVGALMFSAPVWFYSEGIEILGDFWQDGAVSLSAKKDALDHGALTLEFIFNGLFHFFQNIMAFILLSMLSPVSYSVASLIKRVWVIVVAVIWFRGSTTKPQLVGIALTLFGLYLYDRTSTEDAAERRAKNDHFHHKSALLPVVESPDRPRQSGFSLQPIKFAEKTFDAPAAQTKRDEDSGRPNDGQFSGGWLPPGTKQESTWMSGDVKSPKT